MAWLESKLIVLLKYIYSVIAKISNEKSISVLTGSKVKVMCILLEKSFFLYFYRTFLQNNFFQKRYKKFKKLFTT